MVKIKDCQILRMGSMSPIIEKTRWHSPGFADGPAGNKFKETLRSIEGAYGSGLNYRQDMEEFLNVFVDVYSKLKDLDESNIIRKDIYFGKFFTKEDKYHTYQSEFIYNNRLYMNVAIIALFTHPDPIERMRVNFGHAIAYLRINGEWYKSDNEKGFLEYRLHGPPSWDLEYPVRGSQSWIIESMYHFNVEKEWYLKMLSNKQVPTDPLPPNKFHGQVTFRQTDAACWSDSIQSVLLNADGYRESFIELYTKVFFDKDCRSILRVPNDIPCDTIITSKEYINVLRSENEEAYTFKDYLLSNIKIKLGRVLGITDFRIRSPLRKLVNLISLSFFRMISWGMLPWTYGPYVEHIRGSTGLHRILPDKSVGEYSRENNTTMKGILGGYSKKTSRTKAHKTRRLRR